MKSKFNYWKRNMRRKWSTNTAFLDASQTMPDTRKSFFFNSLKMRSGGTLLRFPNRSDVQEFKHVLVCAMHFSNYIVGNRGLPWFMFFAFLVMKTSGILFFGPSFRQPARKASSGEIYLKNKDLYATDL